MNKINPSYEAIALFFTEAIQNRTASIQDFENKKHLFNLEDETEQQFIQFLVMKSFEIEYVNLRPLSYHFLDSGYCQVTEIIAKFAVLQGYQVEHLLDNMQTIENQLNHAMSGFQHFDEKIIIENLPAKGIHDIAKKSFQKPPLR